MLLPFSKHRHCYGFKADILCLHKQDIVDVQKQDTAVGQPRDTAVVQKLDIVRLRNQDAGLGQKQETLFLFKILFKDKRPCSCSASRDIALVRKQDIAA